MLKPFCHHTLFWVVADAAFTSNPLSEHSVFLEALLA